jgi:hypothetical protein
MVMKKSVKFLSLFAFVCVVVSCNDDDNDKRVYFYDEPGIVESIDNDTVVRTTHGSFLVNSLDNSLKKGDLLWTAFEVDLNSKKQEISAEPLYTALSFRYSLVQSSKVIVPADTVAFQEKLSDDYTDDIDLSVLYKDYVDSLLFFGFHNKSPNDNAGYVYELFLNPEKEKDMNHPTLYIRAKKVNIVPVTNGSVNRNELIFAFDMSDFVKYYRSNIAKVGPVKFNIKYKVETKDDQDVYREFKSNPFFWTLP